MTDKAKNLEERIKEVEETTNRYYESDDYIEGDDLFYFLKLNTGVIQELRVENEKLKTSNFVSNFLSNRIQIKKDDLAGMNGALEGYIEKLEAENKELKEKLENSIEKNAEYWDKKRTESIILTDGKLSE